VTVCSSCGTENPESAKFCNECAAPLSDVQPAAATEERKVVTVLFCDLVGFTAAAEQADPEDVRARTRPYHARLREEIEHYGGTVEKFIGDAVMAVFWRARCPRGRRGARRQGRPSHPGGDVRAERARPDARAAGARRAQHGGSGRRARARPEEGEGIVTGDVVNTASRLQGAAPVNGALSRTRPTARPSASSTTRSSTRSRSRASPSRFASTVRSRRAPASEAMSSARMRLRSSVENSRKRFSSAPSSGPSSSAPASS
jgi:class 3 adenylate cyclase